MTRDEHREKCIEAMDLAYRKTCDADALTDLHQRRALAVAFDALTTAGVRVVPIESTSEMRIDGGMAQQKSMQEYGDPEVVWDAMSAAGDLTNPPEKKP